MTETANVNIVERDERRGPRPFAQAAESYGSDVRKMLACDADSLHAATQFSAASIRLQARCAFRLARLALDTPSLIAMDQCYGWPDTSKGRS